MKEEYHVTYSKRYSAEHPPVNARHVLDYLSLALRKYHGMVEWQQRVPEAEIKDIKITKRLYTEEDITPTDHES